MHPRQSAAEHMDGAQTGLFKQTRTALREKGEPQQQENIRHQFKRVRREFLGESVRRIGHQCRAAGGRTLLPEEIADEIKMEFMLRDVGRNTGDCMLTKHFDDIARTGGGLIDGRVLIKDVRLSAE
jgi:hypothetical protein